MDDVKKLKSLKANDNKLDPRVYVVDGKPLKSILKKQKQHRRNFEAGTTKEDAVNTKNKKVSPSRISIAPEVYVREFDITLSSNYDESTMVDEADDKHEWDTFVNNHSHVADADAHQDQNVGEHGSPCNMGNKSYADLFNYGKNDATAGQEVDKLNTHTLKSFSGILSLNSTVDVGESDDNDVELNVSKTNVPKKLNFRSLVNDDKVDNSNIVLPRAAIDKVKSKFANSLVGYFIGKSIAFQFVQNYVTNTWSKFGFEKVMKKDDGIFIFKFVNSMGMEQVLDQGPWLIRNTLLILNKWTPSLPLKKDVVTKVPIWVKLHRVPLVAYSEDGLSLIATQIGKPLMLDVYMSSMCGEAWGHIHFARALIEVRLNSDLKKECPKIIREPVTLVPTNTNSDGFKEVQRKKINDKKADLQPRSRQRDGIRLNKPNPNLYWQKKGTVWKGAAMDSTSNLNKVKGPSTSNSFDVLNTMYVEDESGIPSSRGNQEEEHDERIKELDEFDKDVDEFIFPEGDKFDIRLKGRVRK
ncbi:zinc knuckle CX2CX4HX4C containing protein [Tanacetum coccineum]